jgi:imidazole glycerol-phosphate synthase subunit HisF
MLKKRLIFTLLYNGGDFMLSRNFSLQKVGNLNWLKKNYDFSRISYSIDELIILDVTRENRNLDEFCDALKALTNGCFVPIAAGGGITDVESARKLLRSGADKVVVNSALFAKNSFISNLASEFGQQCVVGSVDIKTSLNNEYEVWSQNGSNYEVGPAKDWIEKVVTNPVGEIYVNSIDKDGTGQGFDLNLLKLLPKEMNKPVILAGGAGNASHLLAGLRDQRVDAVATANLFNFVGDGLKNARQTLVSSGIVLPMWDVNFLENNLRNDGKS